MTSSPSCLSDLPFACITGTLKYFHQHHYHRPLHISSKTLESEFFRPSAHDLIVKHHAEEMLLSFSTRPSHVSKAHDMFGKGREPSFAENGVSLACLSPSWLLCLIRSVAPNPRIQRSEIHASNSLCVVSCFLSLF